LIFPIKLSNPHDTELIIEDIQIQNGQAVVVEGQIVIPRFSSDTIATIHATTSSIVKIKTNHMILTIPLTILGSLQLKQS